MPERCSVPSPATGRRRPIARFSRVSAAWTRGAAPRTLVLALAAAALIPALAGCGGGERAERAANGRVAIDLTEFHISPQTIRLHPGPIVFVVRNRGRLPHRFAVGRGRTSIGDPPVIPPGGEHVMRLTLPRGHYVMYDALSNYDVLGMEGRVIVREDD